MIACDESTTSAVDKRLKNRADFQAADRIYSHTSGRSSTPHSIKIQRYRTAILGSLKDGGVDASIFDLVYERSAELNSMLPDNSEIALYSDFSQYLAFCIDKEQQLLPVSDFALIAYIDHLLIDRKSKKATIDRHVASIVWWCDYLDMEDPRKSHRMKLKLKKVRTSQRGKGAQAQAKGIRYEHLEAALQIFNPEIPRDCQDITLLFTAFETLCRRSEVVAMRWTDLEVQPSGSGIISIAGSKTDQEGEGEYLHLSKNTTDLLLGWRSISAGPNSKEYIFRGIFSNGMMGEALNPGGVNRIFKRIAKRLGLDHTVFSGHSTRVGAAQEMLERNINTAKIMLAGRWSSMSMLTRYAAKFNASKSGMAELTAIIAQERSPTPLAPAIEGGNSVLEGVASPIKSLTQS